MRSVWKNLPASSLVLGLVLATSSCGSVLGFGSVEIRVRNASSLDFSSVVVTFPDHTESYGALAAGQSTEYRAIGKAYRYAGIVVTVEGTSLALVPIDYVGEETLGNGEYTYELDVTAGAQSLTLRFLVD
jgi:hypothetical protein